MDVWIKPMRTEEPNKDSSAPFEKKQYNFLNMQNFLLSCPNRHILSVGESWMQVIAQGGCVNGAWENRGHGKQNISFIICPLVCTGPVFFLATVRSSLLLRGSVLPSSMGNRLLWSSKCLTLCVGRMWEVNRVVLRTPWEEQVSWEPWVRN